MDTTVSSVPNKKVELVWITPNAESIIAEIARVSNPENQKNPEYTGLVKYLIKHKHWSPFEMASFCVKIKTSRAIAAQMIRHRSFSWQEYSQRYSEATEFEPIEIRKQAVKNRQSSLEVFDPIIDYDHSGQPIYASVAIDDFLYQAKALYGKLLEVKVAKEAARFILPLTTQTTIYMTGSIRSWIHYIDLRTKDDVQKEHRDVAMHIKAIFDTELPIVSAALYSLQKEAEDKEFLYSLLISGKLNLEDYK